MRRLLTAGVITAALLGVAAPASAKGPVGATITGPGTEPPIAISGTGEYANGSDFSKFIESTGFWQLVFGADFDGSGLELSDHAPAADLGDRYVITWDLGEATVDSVVYPNAAGGALVYVEPHMWITGFGMHTEGGWFTATRTFKQDFEAFLSGYDAPMTVTSLANTLTPPTLRVPEPVTPTFQAAPIPAASSEMGTDTARDHIFPWAWVSLTAGTGLIFTAIGSAIWAYGRRPRRLTAS